MSVNQNDLPVVPPGVSKMVRAAEQLARACQASAVNSLAQVALQQVRMVEAMYRLALPDLTGVKAMAESVKQAAALAYSPMAETVERINEQYTSLAALTEAAAELEKLAQPPLNIRAREPELPSPPVHRTFRNIKRVIKLTDVEDANKYLGSGWILIAASVNGGNTAFLLGWEGDGEPPRPEGVSGADTPSGDDAK